MSKQIKQMEMDALKRAFGDVRDLVVLTASGVDCHADNQMRQGLRKKKIRLQVVKNSLTRRVFSELGMTGEDKFWAGPTVIAWGAGSLSELSRELDAVLKKNDKIKVKGALSEGQPITFDRAKSMPTRSEAIGRVVSLLVSPAARLVGQILGPASRVAGQIKTLRDRQEEAAPAPAPG